MKTTTFKQFKIDKESVDKEKYIIEYTEYQLDICPDCYYDTESIPPRISKKALKELTNLQKDKHNTKTRINRFKIRLSRKAIEHKNGEYEIVSDIDKCEIHGVSA